MKKHYNLTILYLIRKKIHKSKKPIDLLSVDLDQIVVSYKFEHNGEGFKYFIGYRKDEIVKPLCIVLPQMSGYIKYLKMRVETCLFFSKMMICGINTITFGM